MYKVGTRSRPANHSEGSEGLAKTQLLLVSNLVEDHVSSEKPSWKT